MGLLTALLPALLQSILTISVILRACEFFYPAKNYIQFRSTIFADFSQNPNKFINSERRRCTSASANALESLHHARLDDHLDHLAYRFDRSDNAAEALEYLQLAGEQSARRSSPREAIVYLRDALDEPRPCRPRPNATARSLRSSSHSVRSLQRPSEHPRRCAHSRRERSRCPHGCRSRGLPCPMASCGSVVRTGETRPCA